MTAVELTYEPLPEVEIKPRMRLGRNRLWDKRSLAYTIQPMADGELKTTHWERVSEILDQGHWWDPTIGQWISLGSCVPNTGVGMMGSEPYYSALVEAFGNELPSLDQNLAVGLYEEVTANDPFAGQWRPEDTGSNGLTMAKTMRNHGWTPGFTHATSFEGLLTGLQKGPMGIGIPWMSTMDHPDSEGIVRVGGYMRGGHEIEVLNVLLERELLHCIQSWGEWAKSGHFYIPFKDARWLFDNDSDAFSIEPIGAPAPKPGFITPVGADARLVTTMDKWSKGILSPYTNAGKAKVAYGEWKREHNYA